MPAYQQCSSKWLLDKTTNEFVHFDRRVEPCKIDVPYYFWSYESEDQHILATKKPFGKSRQSIFQRSNIIELNGMLVKLLEGYRSAFVKFLNKADGSLFKIEMDVRPSLYNAFDVDGQRITGIKGMSYKVAINKEVQSFYTALLEPPAEDFQGVSGLGQYPGGGKIFSLGVQHEPYGVEYKGKQLSGRSFAMLCGPWAVLLSDNFEFDSLVALKGVRNGILKVDKFVYTVNPYVVKVVTLMR